MPGELIRLHLLVRRRSLAVQALGLVPLVGMYAALWPSIRDSPSVAEVLQALPEAVRSLLADADMSTPVGYVQTELLALTGPLLMIAFAVAMGASGVAGREDRGTLDLLLANPFTRARVLLEETVRCSYRSSCWSPRSAWHWSSAADGPGWTCPSARSSRR